MLRICYMRYRHFPLFTHGCSKAQSKCPTWEKAGSYMGSVTTASRLAIGYTRTRGVHASHTRILYSLHL